MTYSERLERAAQDIEAVAIDLRGVTVGIEEKIKILEALKALKAASIALGPALMGGKDE